VLGSPYPEPRRPKLHERKAERKMLEAGERRRENGVARGREGRNEDADSRCREHIVPWL
jgi:hypothetical protein